MSRTTRLILLLGGLAAVGCRQVATPVSASSVSSGGSSTSPTSPQTTGLSLAPSSWAIFNPAPPIYAESGGGLAFDFGYNAGAGSAGYLYNTSPPRVLAGRISVSFTVKTTGAPVFNFQTESVNTCPGTANVRPFLQAHNDWAGEFGRWWADPDSASLASGSTTLAIPLTADRWTSVYGKRGNQDAATTAAFADALANVTSLGVTFGGGCFFGHGVFVNRATGTAQFVLTNYAVLP